jgi:hypothetical protein
VNVTNNAPVSGEWRPGMNAHMEYLDTDQQYTGTLFGSILAIEFAISDISNTPEDFVPPFGVGQLPFIIAENDDYLAWYSYTPGNPLELPEGGYYVPSYYFGDVLPGETVQRDLSFAFYGSGITRSDARYALLEGSMANGWDLLSNRSSSLKINDWVSKLSQDEGNLMLTGSNTSLFHNAEPVPEPMSIILITLGVIGIIMRRR